MNDNKTIQFSKVCDPNKWDELPDPIFACKTDEDALKAQRFMNGLYSKIDELERKLKIAEDALDKIETSTEEGSFLEFTATNALKQIRGEE